MFLRKAAHGILAVRFFHYSNLLAHLFKRYAQGPAMHQVLIHIVIHAPCSVGEYVIDDVARVKGFLIPF